MSINNIERLARSQTNPLAEKETLPFQGGVHQIASSQLNPVIEEQNQLEQKIGSIVINLLAFGGCWFLANNFNQTLKDMCYTESLDLCNKYDLLIPTSTYTRYFLSSSISCPYVRLYNKIGSLGVAAGLFGLVYTLAGFLRSNTDYFKNVSINEQKDCWVFRNKTKIINTSAVSFALLSILFDKESHTLTERISHFAIFGLLGGLIGAGFCNKIRRIQQEIQSEKVELTKNVDLKGNRKNDCKNIQ